MRYFFEEEVKTLHDCKNDRFVVGVPGYKQVLVDKIGRIVSDEYKYIKPRSDGYFEAEIDYKRNILIDGSGRVIVGECLDIDHFTDDGIALVTKQDKKKCWVTKDGFEFGKEYKNVGVFAGGFGSVQLENDKWVFIDKNFNVVSPQYDKVSFFDGGYALVQQDKDIFVIDTEFKIRSGPYAGVLCVKDGIVAACEKNPENPKLKYAYYTVDGKKLGKSYKLIYTFKNGISRVSTLEGENFIDMQGNELLEKPALMASNFGPRFAYIGKFDENGEHTFMLIDRNGKPASDWFAYIGGVEDDKPFAIKSHKAKYLNNKGVTVGKGYKRLTGLSEGVAHYESSNDKWTFIFEDGHESAEAYDHAGGFSCGYAVVKNGEVYDAITKAENKLSVISKVAFEIEREPIKVLSVCEKYEDDPEILKFLCEHAIEVLDYAIQSDEYDAGQKAQFADDKKMIEVLKIKTMSQIPEKKSGDDGWEW